MLLHTAARPHTRPIKAQHFPVEIPTTQSVLSYKAVISNLSHSNHETYFCTNSTSLGLAVNFNIHDL